MPKPGIQEAKLWTGSLHDLGRFLRTQLDQLPLPTNRQPGPWLWRQLPRGAVVAFRRDANLRIRCRIARASPQNVVALERGRPRWRQELAVFRRHLDIESWDEVPGTDPRWRAEFVEPAATQLTLTTERQETTHAG